jgi:hypothetical protein
MYKVISFLENELEDEEKQKRGKERKERKTRSKGWVEAMLTAESRQLVHPTSTFDTFISMFIPLQQIRRYLYFQLIQLCS